MDQSAQRHILARRLVQTNLATMKFEVAHPRSPFRQLPIAFAQEYWSESARNVDRLRPESAVYSHPNPACGLAEAQRSAGVAAFRI